METTIMGYMGAISVDIWKFSGPGQSNRQKGFVLLSMRRYLGYSCGILSAQAHILSSQTDVQLLLCSNQQKPHMSEAHLIASRVKGRP